MPKKNEKTSGAGEIQVFELTMDNPEDQEELNSQLRKAGEPARCTPAKVGDAAPGESAAESSNSGL